MCTKRLYNIPIELSRSNDQMSHNYQKKIAVINDFCGFGRCSISVSLPIISAMKIQCCPLPTSVFSNHTGYESYYRTDYTEHMNAYMDEWEKLDLHFNGILTGYLASPEQIDIVKRFLETFKTEKNVVVVDPVMGDHGKLYPTYAPALAERMRVLIAPENEIFIGSSSSSSDGGRTPIISLRFQIYVSIAR